MAELMGNNLPRPDVLVLARPAVTGHRRCRVARDLAVPLAGISCAQVVKASKPMLPGDASPDVIRMIAPLTIALI
jgi:hypothetical protein